MAHSTRLKTRVRLHPWGNLALAGLLAGCASTPAPQGYPLGNGGKPMTHPESVCVQIGPLDSKREDHGQCYQLPPPGTEHVEPLPLDEFGYLFPPLQPRAQLAPTTVSQPAPVIAASPALAPVSTVVPAAAVSTATPAVAFTTKIVRFSTQEPFALNSARLGHDNRVAITAFVNSLAHYHGVLEIQVTGHTDRSGSRHFNQWLSRMRAQSVRLHLLALGVDPREIYIQGAGSSEPRPHARAAADNRYVDIAVKVRVPEQ